MSDERLYYPELRSFIENVKRHSLNFPLQERYDYQKITASFIKEEQGLKKYKDSFIVKHGLSLLKHYQHFLKENNCVDFMDLIVEAKYLLEQEALREKWNRKFSYIQVDEMQDTSIREYDIIKILAKDNNLALFGDFNQTIYEWRGSSPKSMMEDFKKDFSPKAMTLSINYRSTQVLLEAANHYIRNSALYPIWCTATSLVKGDKICILEGGSKDEEIQLIADSIKTFGQKSVAVLTRTNDYAKRIADFFQKENLPCTVIEETKLFRKKEVKDLLAFFDYAVNERNGHALYKICQHPAVDMASWLISQLNLTKACHMYLHDWFNAESKDPYAKLFSAYKKGEIIVLDVESTGLDTTKDDIIQIAGIRYGERGVLETLDLLVKPTKPVGDSYFIHGFTDALLEEKGMAPKEALNQLRVFIKDKVLVGHNINYDLQIIKSMLGRYQLPSLQYLGVYDTLDLSAKVYPKMWDHKLSTLAAFVQTQAQPNHNALQDILATSEVLTHLIFKIQEKTQERFEKLEAFYSYLDEYKSKVTAIKQYILTHTVPQSIIYMMNDCSFKQYYHSKEINSLRELYKAAAFLYDEKGTIEDNIIQLLTYASLHYSEIEQSEFFKDRIPIITIHQAKGLEFDHVYIAGCNDKVFPSARSVKEHYLEEEKRLFYVGITRARKNLFLSYHLEKPRSIFLDEIAEEYKHYKRYGQNL